ncbi:magnesium transporter [Gynuella sunshinyii]|uniref:Mg/Co/Ni transporter MgtE (Contains CBS domain) n=1 Tax=Gynuella sunshinyii YC6258 TaxID=1445510 RepID=A0A0C5VRM1_9GAMM|nr:magnesium transporter [Gynuella sunshinyii]AJQ96886.1 mg/Co/Ni transporter MgtE (contains CBS domain) [Gynuella sunshinyii YC6258]
MVNPDLRESLLGWLLDQFAEGVPALPLETPGFSSNDWAFFIEGMYPDHRLGLFQEIPLELRGDVLAVTNDDVRRRLIEQLSTNELYNLAESTSSEHLVEVLGMMPSHVLLRAIKRLDSDEQELVHKALSYTDRKIGRYVSRAVLTVTPEATAAMARTALKQQQVPEYTDRLLLVDDKGIFKGSVDLEILQSAPARQALSELSDLDEKHMLLADQDYGEAALDMKSSGFAMMPVVNEQHELLGRITIREALELAVDYYENQLLAQGGMNDEDLFAPVKVSVARRTVWLGINLITALAASWVIGLFELALSKIVALAVLMPVVASMGGIAGSQTLTLTIRGLATGQINNANLTLLAHKEVRIGLVNGLIWALIIGVVVSWWFGNPGLSFVIAIAIWINVLAAACAGILVPVILDRMKIDPALAGSVVLTTVTDVVGFFAFLGTATLLLI